MKTKRGHPYLVALRRCVFAPAGLALLVSSALVPGVHAETRPNILFIALDDLVPVSRAHVDDPGLLLRTLIPRAEARHAFSEVLTPNLNRLAERGTTFTRAWTSYPLCNPSRVALLTGISAARSGYKENQGATFRSAGPLLSGAVTIPERFRLAGYDTLGVGKIFHSTFAEYDADGKIVKDWPDLAHSWSSYLQTVVGTLNDVGGGDEEARSLKALCAVEAKPTAAQPDWMNADLAATLLRKGIVRIGDASHKPVSLAIVPGRPFFLGVGIRRPHAPWAVPQEWLDRIPAHLLDDAELDLLVESDDRKDLRGVGNGLKGKMGTLFGYDGTARTAASSRNDLLQSIRHYLAAIAFADACVGHVLDALTASSYAKNTIVVLWSDHGYGLGQKLHFGKNNLWEPSLRSEFIIADLRKPSAGRKIEEPVSLLDIYPTLCDLAGIDDRGYATDGHSLAKTVLDGSPPAERPILSSHGADDYAVRLGPWKLITHGSGETLDELYNLDADPLERKNLLFRPDAKALEVAGKLRAEIQKSLKP